MLFRIISPVGDDLKTCSKYVVLEVPIQSKSKSTPNPPLGAGPWRIGEAMLPQRPDLGIVALIAGYITVTEKVQARRGYFGRAEILV